MEQILGKVLEKPRLYFFKPDLNQIYIQIGLTNARQQQPIIVEFQAVYELNENKPYNDFAEDRAYGFEGINDKFIIRRNDAGIGTGHLWKRKELLNIEKDSSKRLFNLILAPSKPTFTPILTLAALINSSAFFLPTLFFAASLITEIISSNVSSKISVGNGILFKI